METMDNEKNIIFKFVPEIKDRWDELHLEFQQANRPLYDALKWINLNPSSLSYTRLFKALDKAKLFMVVPNEEAELWGLTNKLTVNQLQLSPAFLSKNGAAFAPIVLTSIPELASCLPLVYQIYLHSNPPLKMIITRQDLHDINLASKQLAERLKESTGNADIIKGILLDFSSKNNFILEKEAIDVWDHFKTRINLEAQNKISLSSLKRKLVNNIVSPEKSTHRMFSTTTWASIHTPQIEGVSAVTIDNFPSAKKTTPCLILSFSENTPQSQRNTLIDNLSHHLAENTISDKYNYIVILDKDELSLLKNWDPSLAIHTDCKSHQAKFLDADFDLNNTPNATIEISSPKQSNTVWPKLKGIKDYNTEIENGFEFF